MKRLALAALLAAAMLASAYGPPPAGPEADRAAPAARDGFLGSGNRHDAGDASG